MGAYPGTYVHTADNAVPPLDGELAGLLEDLAGVHPGIDLIRDGIRLICLERLSRDQTQTLLGTLGGSADATDVIALVGAAIGRLTNPDANPCLRELADDQQKNVRRIGAGVAVDMATTAPRDLVAATCIRIDPYTTADDLAELDDLDGGGLR